MHMKKERNIFMTKLWHSLKNKAKTIHELAKQFPEKTYRQLEKYRDADRNEEAQQIITQQENEELKADQGKEIDYHRYWKKRAEEAEGELSIVKGIGTNSPEMKSLKAEVAALKQQLHTDRNEYQNELDRVKRENNDLHNRVAALLDEVRPDELSRVKKENNNLHKKIAALLDAVDPDKNLQKARESGM